MREYLVEGVAGGFPFIVDRTKPMVSESKPGGGSFTRIPGRFSVCDCINGNNRRYGNITRISIRTKLERKTQNIKLRMIKKTGLQYFFILCSMFNVLIL